MSFIADRMKKIDSSGIRKMFNLAAKMKDPINLSIGQPDFDVPVNVKEDMINAVREGHNRYTMTQGTPELRNAVLEKRFAGKGYSTENILITSGVSGGILLSLMVLLNPGDEMMVFDPYFVMYPHIANLMGAVPKVVDINPDFKITKEKLEAAYSDKVKVMMLNTPANPTGAVLSVEELKIIATFAKEKNIFVISDEIYSDFIYEGDFVSISDFYKNTLVLSGFSKNLAMTGLRVGYAVGPEEVISQMITLQQYTFVCSPAPAQKGVEKHVDYNLKPLVDSYRIKRDIVYQGLKDKFDIVKPSGAFYTYVRLKNGMSGTSFVERAIENNVLVIPSTAFSAHDDAFRISFAAKDETLYKGVDVLNKIV